MESNFLKFIHIYCIPKNTCKKWYFSKYYYIFSLFFSCMMSSIWPSLFNRRCGSEESNFLKFIHIYCNPKNTHEKWYFSKYYCIFSLFFSWMMLSIWPSLFNRRCGSELMFCSISSSTSLFLHPLKP